MGATVIPPWGCTRGCITNERPQHREHTRCRSSRSSSRQRDSLAAAAAPGAVPAVKICGVVAEEDAVLAARAGAAFVGAILSPDFSRTVTQATAKAIFSAARDGGAEPVGVFVEESAEQILEACQATGLRTVQLHGTNARKALPKLPPELQVFYVMQVSSDGEMVTKLPEVTAELQQEALTRPIEWILVDGMRGGSGKPYNYGKVKVPRGRAQKGWILAGGLNASNVQQAVAALRPDVVDVSSGVVASSQTQRKDEARIREFMQAVQACAA